MVVIRLKFLFKMGYAKMDQKGTGLHLRTFSRAFIVDDGEQRFVFVSVDSAMVGHDVRAAVSLYNFLAPKFSKKKISHACEWLSLLRKWRTRWEIDRCTSCQIRFFLNF